MRRHSFSSAMAARMKKRPAAASVDVQPAKRQLLHQDEQLIATIIKALVSQDSLSQSMKEMLGSLAKTCLAVHRDQRHPFQSASVEEIGNVLAAVKASLDNAASAAQDQFDEVTASRVEREAQVSEKMSLLSNCDADIVSKEAALKHASHELDAATDAVEDAQRKLGVALTARSSMQTKRNSLSSLQSDCLAPLKGRAASGAEVKQLLSKCQRLAIDESLISILPNGLKKAPAERGDFDKMALSHLDIDISNRLGELSASLDHEDAAIAQLEEGVGSTRATHSHAIRQLDEHQADLSNAKLRRKECAVSLKVANKAVESFSIDVKRAADALDAAKRALAEHTQGPSAAFLFLRNCDGHDSRPRGYLEEVAPSPTQTAKGGA